MPLESFIIAARKVKFQQTVQQKPVDPVKPIPNLIDATDFASSSESDFLKPSKASLSTSVNVIARELESKRALNVVSLKSVSWENCKCLKRSSEKLFCTKFLALCAQEKCPKKFIEV